MKKSIKLIFTLVLAPILTGVSFANNHWSDEHSQDVKGGTITYEQVTYIEFNYTPTGNAERDQWFANLPKSRSKAKILYFNADYSLYEEDLNAESEVLEGRQAAILDRIAMGQPPAPIIQKVFMNYKKSIKTEQVELMTRLFLIENKMEGQAWKPGTEQRKIQGYICQNATMKKGEKTITAWFTTKIPVSVGPEVYSGLPGLILAVDIDGKNVILAKSVILTPPDEKNLVVPKEGNKTSQEEFDQILTEKVKEWEEQRANQRRDRRD